MSLNYDITKDVRYQQGVDTGIAFVAKCQADIAADKA